MNNVTIWEMIAQTSWWFFVIIGAIVYISFQATKPRQLHLNQLLIIPVIFIILATLGIIGIQAVTATYFLILGAGFCLGLPLGWLQFAALRIKAMRGTKKLYIPGTWLLFFLIPCLLFLRFYLGYELSLQPDVIKSPAVTPYIMFAYGAMIGLFVGRYAYALRRIKYGPYQD